MARPRTRRPGNLPAEATSFIGRRRELAELRQRLAAARLVSLVGPGGVGKTRLAIRIASDLQRGFRDGAWLVELADLHDPALLNNTVLAALDLRDQATTEPSALLLAFVRDKQLLLVIDNCEHLLGPAAQLVTTLMRTAPDMRVLATSREPLTIPGEHVVPVPPLELPPSPGDAPPAALRHNEAVTLFAERAAAASGTFDVSDANIVAVADLCRRLDGLPLAIELAAVRTRVLTPEQMLSRLADRFGLLTGGSRAALPRHQTLRTTIEWSHDLLAADERALLRRVSIFAGRFRLEDVESVCAFDIVSSERVLDVLSSLVDKSLVVKEDASAVACYRMHESMREFARLKLQDAHEADVVEERCVTYYLALCGSSALGARFRLIEWLGRMELEIDNVRWVLRRLLTREDFPRGLALASALSWYWITRATSEGAWWLDTLLASEREHPAVDAWAYFIRGFLAVLLADPTAARPALDRGIAVARDSGQLLPLAQSLAMASIVEGMLGQRASARRLLDEADVVAQGLDDVPARVAVLQARSLNGFFEGDPDAVRSASTEGVGLSREVGDLYSLQMLLMNLGLAGLADGRLDPSEAHLSEALRIAQQIDDRVAQFYLLGAFGCHAVASGTPRRGAQLLGAAHTLRLGVGASVNSITDQLLVQAEAAARTALGPSKYEAEFAAGQRLSRAAAAALALGTTPRAASVSSEDAFASLLGKREHEVARLVGDGLSNKQIGTRLFISERTVDSHVRSILNKLGVSSRAQIAAWITSLSQAE